MCNLLFCLQHFLVAMFLAFINALCLILCVEETRPNELPAVKQEPITVDEYLFVEDAYVKHVIVNMMVFFIYGTGIWVVNQNEREEESERHFCDGCGHPYGT